MVGEAALIFLQEPEDFSGGVLDAGIAGAAGGHVDLGLAGWGLGSGTGQNCREGNPAIFARVLRNTTRPVPC